MLKYDIGKEQGPCYFREEQTLQKYIEITNCVIHIEIRNYVIH